jgi:GT2 family glycosyltransferase
MASSKTKPIISVIIVNYNVRDFLSQAITALQRALKGIRSEIIVVDNASIDGSVELVKKKFRSVKLITSNKNLGFAKANNLGLKISSGKYVLLLNPDTVVQENTIRVMLSFFDEHHETGLAGCKIIDPDGSFQLGCRRSFPSPWVSFCKISGLSALFPKSRLFGKYNLTYLDADKGYQVDAISGSFMMFRRQVFEQIGGLDEDFFMYGEDLDFCYRVQTQGWKINYVPETTIIHYRGQSTRRSNIDEIKTFYQAMHLFVEKHLGQSVFLKIILRIAISMTSRLAALKELLYPLRPALVDIFFIDLSIFLAELIWLDRLTQIPAYGYPMMYTIPAILTVMSLYSMGVYTFRRMSLSRTVAGVTVSFLLVSAIVAFFKHYAFSRMVLIISGALSAIFLSGWRLLFQFIFRRTTDEYGGFFSRRTLVVGTNKEAQELVHRLHHRADESYRVIGYIDPSSKDVGSSINAIPVVGTLDGINKVIKEHRISDIIFPAKILSYSEILSVIARAREFSVNFHIVPTSLEVIIGKASVDSIDGLPLVEITYNIEKPLNRFFKRIMDILISLILLIFVYPFFILKKTLTGFSDSRFILNLPKVFSGKMSLVGSPKEFLTAASDEISFGKSGLTGLIQLRGSNSLTPKDIEQFKLYYAKNQSTSLDIEILLRTLFKKK